MGLFNRFLSGDCILALQRRKAIFERRASFMLINQFMLVDCVGIASELIEPLGKHVFLVGD